MYRLVRPPKLSGTGPLEVFRAISTAPQDLVQRPMQFVRNTDAYRGLNVDRSPTTAAALHSANVQHVVKVWTELAFEHVRQLVAPGAPSRLDSVYAAPDVYEAFSFTEQTGIAHRVHRGVVADGVPWQLVDMGSFGIVAPETPDAHGFDNAWSLACNRASNYWMTGHATPSTPFFAEVLVGGPLVIDPEPLRLLDVMEAHALLAR